MKEHTKPFIDIDNLNSDPYNQFRFWLNDAYQIKVNNPNVMVLATCGNDNRPSSRFVLLKGFDDNGFVFFTNYLSKKSVQISENPYASLVFYWSEMERQIRIEGKIEKTSLKESDDYFNIRPEGSKIGAWISTQSQKIPDREYIEKLEKEYKYKFQNKSPERPVNWGGYRLKPFLFEFWQERENRLHDRFEYTLINQTWEISRLAP